MVGDLEPQKQTSGAQPICNSDCKRIAKPDCFRFSYLRMRRFGSVQSVAHRMAGSFPFLGGGWAPGMGSKERTGGRTSLRWGVELQFPQLYRPHGCAAQRVESGREEVSEGRLPLSPGVRGDACESRFPLEEWRVHNAAFSRPDASAGHR